MTDTPAANGPTGDSAADSAATSNNCREPPSDPSALVPHLEGITYGDLETAIKVLNAVAALNPKKRKPPKQTPSNDDDDDNIPDPTFDGLAQYKHTNLRPLRKALAGCLNLHQRTMYQGVAEGDHYDQRQEERSLKRQKMAEKDLYKKHIATTALRKGRVERLQAALIEGSSEEHLSIQAAFMVPDGHVDTTSTTATRLLTAQGYEDTTQPVTLPCLRSCYVCKIRFRDLHSFYDQLCPACAAINWDKRHQTADLKGRVALVTGARVKIGYHVCLKLLRAGATVIATSRFPNAAVDAYRSEADFDVWQQQLHVYGLDLRDVAGLEALTRFIKQQFAAQGIDILINNACQTIRRPAGYYKPAIDKEQKLWRKADTVHKDRLQGCLEFERIRRTIVMDQKHRQPDTGTDNVVTPSPQLLDASTAYNGHTGKCNQITTVTEVGIVSTDESHNELVSTTNGIEAPFESTGVSHSAAMSQMVILPEDSGVNDDILPPGVSDINGQQLDLRTANSWLLRMEQVSTPELMECMFINAIAPFVLNSRLKPLMAVPNDSSRPDRYIINVSAMEGKFYRFKTECHPHTNMAKAALNMLTRTSADDLAKRYRIFMNSVDTGWINDENPLDKASRIAKDNLFQTPIDEIDAAARILDPIFTGVNGGEESSKMYGKFLKDYRESEW